MTRFCALSSNGTSAPEEHKFLDATTFRRVFRLFSPRHCNELADVEDTARRMVWTKNGLGKSRWTWIQRYVVFMAHKRGPKKVGSQMRPVKPVIEDTRAFEPGVAVTDALLAIQKFISEHKADFLVGGPMRFEAAFAARGVLTKYK